MLNGLKLKIRNIFKREVVTTVQMRAGTGISASYVGGHSSYGSEYGSGSKWPLGMSRGPSINIKDHTAIRQQVRDAMYDSTVAKSMVDRFADTVVDTGLKLKPVPIAEMLGITPEQAEEWAEDVAERFHLWAKSKKSQRSRINNFYQNQHLYQKFQQRDNDIFVRLYYGRDKDLINPLQIDFVDPNQIYGYDYSTDYVQYPACDGIKRDSSGREISYKVWNTAEDGSFKETTVPAVGAKSGRYFMLHGFCPEYAGQGRGYSRLTHAIQEFENLTDFTASTIKKAIAQASLTMSVENQEQDASNPLEGRVAEVIPDYGSHPNDRASDPEITNDMLDPAINYQSMPEATITQPGSVGVFNLRRGDTLKYLQDTSPSQAYDSFVLSFTSFLAASQGMPVEVLLMKFSNNYSASRASLILFWRVAQIWRDEMSADFLDPTYEMWLSEEIAAGRISAPGWSDKKLKQAWLNAEWAGAPMPNIDPLKTANADKEYVAMGAQTLDDVARNFNGSSGKANRAKNARQFEELPGAPWNSAPAEPENAEEPSDDDEKEGDE